MSDEKNLNPFMNEHVKELERDESFIYLSDKHTVVRFSKESSAIDPLLDSGWVQVSFVNWYMGLSPDTRSAIEDGRSEEVL